MFPPKSSVKLYTYLLGLLFGLTPPSDFNCIYCFAGNLLNLSNTEGTLYVPGPGVSFIYPVTFILDPNPNVIAENLEPSVRV